MLGDAEEWGHRGLNPRAPSLLAAGCSSCRHGRSQGGDAGQFPRDSKVYGMWAPAQNKHLFSWNSFPALLQDITGQLTLYVLVNPDAGMHTHRMQPVSLSQQRGSNGLPGCPSVLSKFFLGTFRQLFDSFRKSPECWADSPYTKWSSQGGSASAWCCVHPVLIFYTWGKLLNASKNRFMKIPSPSSHLFLFHPM